MIFSCPLCGNSIDDILEIPYAFFRHMDFEIIKHNGKVLRCHSCQLVSNYLTEQETKVISELFRSKEYSECKLMRHTLHTSNGFKTRTELQAKLIYEKLDFEKPSILEIGCYQGDLLRDLDFYYKSANIHGFDVINCHPNFPSNENIHYWSGDLTDIDGKFNLIILSGSIMYIKSLSYLFEQIRRLLLPNGCVFIQTADISKNPYGILLGDQYYYYTPDIMGNMCAFYGFNFELFVCNEFPKELVGIARQSNIETPLYNEDKTIYECINTIRKNAKLIRNLSDKYSNFGVLGTTSAAAFVDSLLGKQKVKFFVDENTGRIGTKFHGKDVIHPKALHSADVVIIPYGVSSNSIKRRLSKKYKGKFICL